MGWPENVMAMSHASTVLPASTPVTMTTYCADHAGGAEARVKADAERQREHADRAREQHPLHDDDHRFGHAAEEGDDRLAQSGASCVMAKAKKIVNTASARMLSLAAAVTGLVGARLCSQETKVGGSRMATAWSPMAAMKAFSRGAVDGQAASQPCVAITAEGRLRRRSGS